MKIQGSKLNKGVRFGRTIISYSFHTWGLWIGGRIISGDDVRLSGYCLHAGPLLIMTNLRLA